MNLVLIRMLFTLIRRALLILSPSLPLQALALLLIRGTIAIIVACNISILLGIYTILIYASGLLVLLAYFVALTPNQTLNTPSRTTSLILLQILTILVTQTWLPTSILHFSNTSVKFSPITSLLSPSSTSLLVIIAATLILTIIAVVKVSGIRRGPIRPWRSN